MKTFGKSWKYFEINLVIGDMYWLAGEFKLDRHGAKIELSLAGVTFELAFAWK